MKKQLIVQKSSFGQFFAFLLVNQNVDAQLYTHVKNHHYHMIYLILDYSIFLPQICSMEMLFVKNSFTKVLKFLLFFITINTTMNEPI
jgi:hypothetical protein